MAHRHFGSGLLLAGALSASAMAQGVIRDGNARFSYNVNPLPGSTDFQPDSTTDHLFWNWWWYRVDGAPAESQMSPPLTQSYVGNVASGGASEPSFDWRLRVTLTDGPVPGQAQIVERMTLINTTNNPIRVALFNYVDFDVGQSAGGDSAILVNPQLMRITDAGGDFAEFLAVGANAWEVQAWPVLINALNDASVTNLSNTGLPFGPGDFTGAFQWNLSIPVGGSVTVFEGLAINMEAVPAPGVLALLGLGGLLAMRRRRG